MIRVRRYFIELGSGAFLFVSLLIALGAQAQAARFSGGYLLQVCSFDAQGAELSPGSHVACQAYIAGILDYHALIRSMGVAPSVDFCVPEGESLYDIQKQVVGYLVRNKQEQGPFIAAPGVALALFNAYPCKN